MPSVTFQDVPLFWLNYRHPRGRFAGAVVIESSTLVSARMAASVYGLNDRLEFASGHELDQESALKVPTDVLGRLLDNRELRKLSRMLVGPVKPSARSLWRPKAQRRAGKPVMDLTMTLILRRMRAQDRIEGREPVDTGEDDYAVVDETRIGRIYREPIHGEMKWRWFLQTMPAPPPNSGTADTLDQAKAAFAKRYQEVKRGK